MENNIIQQIREELGGFRDEIRSELKTVNESLGGLRSDIDSNTKELRRNSIQGKQTLQYFSSLTAVPTCLNVK
ncbi:hypothetical protein IWW34DRAFT_349224 [Fusarium oxysporum f. sp. albedinis]|nr:hypothetical protein IWW34DRAFT_349224 [Fusarium oxysporum f. sp. albedinis]KAK2471853.1 hypothetical protein H9L39_16536 [Fusarium oxysporum f. sp. albedinis]